MTSKLQNDGVRRNSSIPCGIANGSSHPPSAVRVVIVLDMLGALLCIGTALGVYLGRQVIVEICLRLTGWWSTAPLQPTDYQHLGGVFLVIGVTYGTAIIGIRWRSRIWWWAQMFLLVPFIINWPLGTLAAVVVGRLMLRADVKQHFLSRDREQLVGALSDVPNCDRIGEG